MLIIRMIFKELWHRKVNFLLGVLAATTAVAVVVAFFTASKASERETARLMLSLGYNLHVIAKDADIGVFLMTGLADQTMPEAYVAKLAAQNSISYNHLLATLEGKMKWRGVDVILTGSGPGGVPAGTAEAGDGFQRRAGDGLCRTPRRRRCWRCRRAAPST